MKKNRKYIIWIVVGIFLIGGYFIADSILFNGVKSKTINKDGFQANYFAKNDIKEKAAIVLVGGGQWGDYWGQEFAKKGFVGLSLPYIGREGLPKLLEEINLEYFENTLNWLTTQAEVDPKKIIIMGASRNGELSLLIASTFPELVGGVIAYAPSSVSWSNTVLAYNSKELKPSWKYQGKSIPFIPMDRISGNNSNKIETLKYWKDGLAKTDFVAQAAIKVENINGPILLFSGKEDKVWPATFMADMIEQRLKQNNFQYSFLNIKYDEAGHLISGHPEINSDIRTGTMNIDGKDFEYEFGGTNEGDQKAKQDAKARVMEFIENL